MATVYGVEATKAYNSEPATKISQGKFAGQLHVIMDSYSLSADLASGDVIRMGGKIPAGAKILNVEVKFPDLDASGGTLDVGWLASSDAVEAADADGFMANLDVTSAGFAALASATHFANPGYLKEFAAECQAAITVDGDTDATSGTIYMNIWYVVS